MTGKSSQANLTSHTLSTNSLLFRVIEAYTREDPIENLKASFKTFELMETRRQLGEVTPDERVYTTFMKAMTRGRAPGLHQKAKVLLARMHKLYAEGNREIEPKNFSYNAALNACAECVHIENAPLGDAFKTALEIFTELRKSKVKADHVTYGNMLRCSRLLPEGEKRDKFVSATFRLCCDQGFMNDFVLRDLRESAGPDLLEELLGRNPDVDMYALPREWSRMLDTGGSKRNRDGNRGNTYRTYAG